MQEDKNMGVWRQFLEVKDALSIVFKVFLEGIVEEKSISKGLLQRIDLLYRIHI